MKPLVNGNTNVPPPSCDFISLFDISNPTCYKCRF